MNRVWRLGGSKPLSSEEMAAIANAVSGTKAFTAADYEGEKSRISGDHCNCYGNGVFVLDNRVGSEKTYMRCIHCGGGSHL